MVFEAFPQVKEVILYGSRALGTFKACSDIDLTVKGDLVDHFTLNQISSQLDDLLLPYSIDLSIYSYIESPDLLDHIQRVGQIFFSQRY